ncbi:hypothetical protein FJZ19_03595 [Candidatus Pacearchaeota archaeon]|nr:hypothetical protein [Candidatus Pacearchaeota archaeon]
MKTQQIPVAEKREFSEMTQKEKKNFLSMDLAERIIRVEQRVSAHFHKPVQYKDTEYYKSMGKENQKKFEDYLRKKKRKKYLLGIAFILPVLFILVLRVEFTGNAIKETFGYTIPSLLTWVLVIVVFFIVVFGGFRLRSEMKKEKKYKEYYEILMRSMTRKY